MAPLKRSAPEKKHFSEAPKPRKTQFGMFFGGFWLHKTNQKAWHLWGLGGDFECCSSIIDVLDGFVQVCFAGVCRWLWDFFPGVLWCSFHPLPPKARNCSKRSGIPISCLKRALDATEPRGNVAGVFGCCRGARLVEFCECLKFFCLFPLEFLAWGSKLSIPARSLLFWELCSFCLWSRPVMMSPTWICYEQRKVPNSANKAF